MDLGAYSEWAVQLVNTVDPARPDDDRLAELDDLRAFFADSEHFGLHLTRTDLIDLVKSRAPLRAVFTAAAGGDSPAAVNRLNHLLAEYPVRPQVSGHDGNDWHLHLTDTGGVAERYIAGAAMGLAMIVTGLGVDRLGECQASGCSGVFVDTSTNRSRRYCSQRCATRANVAALRARRKVGTP